MATIDVSDIKEEDLLAALVNHGQPMGLGWLHYRTVTPDECLEFLLANGPRVDYAFGVPIKATFDGKTFRTDLYDRDQGLGHGEHVVARLRREGK